jgi:uncharacterized membrane protein
MIVSQEVIYSISELIDFTGVVIIAGGALVGVLRFLRDLIERLPTQHSYDRLRRFLGRSLLLGLEFLVAGDIIKTVAIEPTFDSVIVLAVIVLVRTVLSLSIDVEIDGRWPWEAARQEKLAEFAEGRSTPPADTPERRADLHQR